MGQHYLNYLYSPEAIAVFGASTATDAVGGRIYRNIKDSAFEGPIYPINPKYQMLDDQQCYASISEIDKPVNLAIIATPAQTVPDIIRQCGEHGVRAAIIISAGFNEGLEKNASLKQSVLEFAHYYQMRILGPNCLGLIHPPTKLNATFSKNTAKLGHLALVSQSGAICTAILDWAELNDVGFSSITSLGDAADVDFGDVLDYLAQDKHTRSILLYVEGIRDARSFISGLRVAARMKPVIVIKAGRHPEGSRAAVTHTGAMVGADDVFDAALQRAGVVRAMSLAQLFAAARLLSTRARVSNNRLAIITNGGGLGVMATDRAIDLGIRLSSLSEQTITELSKHLPPQWSHGNPVDILGDADPERYKIAVKACLADADVDGILVMLTPQAMTDASACANAVIEAMQDSSKPVLTCWMGERHVKAGREIFRQHRIPNFTNPESSVEAFSYLARHYLNQQMLMQVPGPIQSRSESDIEGARLIIQSVLAEKRKLLNITESKAVMRAFNIPVTASIECRSANDALVAAESVGFPVVMKINSVDITHKSDVGGIRLNIINAQAVRSTYNELIEEVRKNAGEIDIEGVTIEPMYKSRHGRELLVGVIRDPVFGPAITFGAGGVNVEAVRDRAVALPPLNSFLIDKMINQTNVSRLLGSYRNIPAINMGALTHVLRRVSEMICELPEIIELDINPVIADENGVVVLDARIVIDYLPPSLQRYQHMAIQPYPAYMVSDFQLADGTNISIRPIRPEDASIEKSFVTSLSPRSRYFRFMEELKELTQEMLVRFTQLDYHRELALIAVHGKPGQETELAVARYAMNPDGSSCEFALVVADDWQNKGIGTHLMNQLILAARDRGLKTMEGEVLSDNQGMLDLVSNLGFKVSTSKDDSRIKTVSRKL